MVDYENASAAPFPETDWKLVRSAAAGSERALQSLAASYCRPVYAFFRRLGLDRETAQDLTQDFFAECILDPERRNRVLPDRDALKLRLRTWMRACLRNYAANYRDRLRAVKRGGSCRVVPLDPEVAERSIAFLPEEDPFSAFDRQWAAELMAAVLRRLGDELRPSPLSILNMAASGRSDEEIARCLGMTPDAVARARNRAVARARGILAEEVCRTVESPDQLREELAELSHLVGFGRVG